MENHKFVFLGGLHKSGTSMLFKCLRDHPMISGFKDTGVPEDEGQWLQSVYPVAKTYGGPGLFGFDRSSIIDETSPLVSQENAKKIFSEWKIHWDLTRPVLLEKSPPNLVHSRFLQALFPNSFFIILIRHPIAVSYATQKWSRTYLHSLLQHWLICHEQFEIDRGYLQNLLVLKYEDFVKEPQTTLNKIYEFLDIDHVQLTQKVISDVNNKYFAKWKRRQDSIFTRFYTKYIINKYETRVNRFGYSLKDLNMAEAYCYIK